MGTLYGGSAIIMNKAKDVQLKIIPSKIANDFIKKTHYSGKVAVNSNLHFGAFLNNVLHGVMSFGSPIDKRKVIGLVKDTKWNEMLELNRMAFDDKLPIHSESRCLARAFRMIKKNAPHIKWILSFADGTQCGDGTIYRASGFVLTSIKKNTSIGYSEKTKSIVAKHGVTAKKYGKVIPLKGYQLRYIYFMNPNDKEKLTIPMIPFSKIKEMGASMYKGKNCHSGVNGSTSSIQDESRGSIPTEWLSNYA